MPEYIKVAIILTVFTVVAGEAFRANATVAGDIIQTDTTISARTSRTIIDVDRAKATFPASSTYTSKGIDSLYTCGTILAWVHGAFIYICMVKMKQMQTYNVNSSVMKF